MQEISAINKYIKNARRKQNISQKEIAEHLCITAQSYSMKERGERPISTIELVKILKFLNIKIKFFCKNVKHKV
ncbi:helix-turn-helix domain-containing protein [Oceanobacillus oncorhynchi]|uniref:helix-turn-helix domain-containing protein n=1 Tax=Oceanobacillus oncorhynchi TaxID=545501 RepID=UPI0018691C84|nr:helix-turn-helix transcriptional regulator [Oceanobacillus oncorhynchi]